MPRRKKPLWYRKSLDMGVILLGIIAVQVMFAQHVDKDEYQRIIGTSLVFAIRELLGKREV